MMWKLLRSLLFLLAAETAHNFTLSLLALSQRLQFPVSLIGWWFARAHKPVLAMGLTFPSRVGLAAGLDKNAVAYDAFIAMGFGFVEIGSVTRHAQPGNPKPRLFRLPADRALLNRMGFNNHGAEVVRSRLAGPRRGIVGVNIGKTKVVPEERAIEDYVASAELLAPVADYLVVNVSSPNTPGLRDLQSVEKLRPLLLAVQQANARVCESPKPLLVKIAPDLADEDILAIVDLVLSLKLTGMVLTNTTISRDGLKSTNVSLLGAGGISGAPLKARSLDVLRLVSARAGKSLCLISVGGIASRADVAERIAAGATLVQVYSEFVYSGPNVLRSLSSAA